MKKQKYSVVAGILLFILAALFSISLLVVAIDFGGISPAKNSIFYSLGKIFTGVYGLCSVCIPIFLIVAGFQCFMSKWRIRNGVILLGSVIPFFTLDAVEHICRMFLNSETDSVLIVKLSSTLLIGALILAAEYLLLSILGDVLENSLSENRAFSSEGDEIKFYADETDEQDDSEIDDSLEKDEEPLETEENQSYEEAKILNREQSEEKVDLSTDKIFLQQKEILKDLIDGDKSQPSDATVAEDETLVPSEPISRELEEEFAEEEITDDEDEEEEPTIIENEDFDDTAVIPESVAEEEILEEEDFAEIEDERADEAEAENELESENEPVFENSDEDDALIAEMNRIYGGEGEVVEKEEVSSEDVPTEEVPAEEENPVVRDVALPDFEDDVSFEEESLPVNTDDFQNEEDEMANAQPVEVSDSEYNYLTEESLPENEENPADFINIEDIADDSAEAEDGDSMGIDDIFSEMDEDAAANPVFKPQDEPTAVDSLYQGEDSENSDETDDDLDDEDRSLSEVDGIDFEETESDSQDFGEEISDDDLIEDQINEIDGLEFEEEVEAPDVVSADEVEEARQNQIEEEKQTNYRKLSEYKIPTDLLEKFENDEYWRIDDETKAAGENLKQTLNEFGIEAEVTGIRKGPVVTMFELLPAPGVKLSKIVNLQDNIALAMAAKSVRIVAPIPGRHAVGIEIPNKERAIVSFREIIEQNLPEYKKMAIPVILGKDISGQSQIIDIAKTPHLLIAGATGAGKSVCVNSIILSILYNRSPRDVKLIMVDPKVVELKLYNDIPHLLTPVVTEPKRALQVLQYCICEMERRYALLDGMGVRDIVSYNTRIRERNIATEKLPYIVVIIDEFADLMATSGKELETNVARLTAMSRAVGIHLVLATQRPSVNVITGLIKANIPSRIAFMVASRTDSNIIIDAVGAEKLLGKGDMLYTSAVNPIPTRIQGTLVGDNEVERVVEYVKSFGGPDYIDDEIFVDDDEEEDDEPGLFSDGEDPLYDQALQIVVQTGKASASYLQRRLKIGYNRAARLVEDMEARGIVGPANGSKPREIIHMP